MYRCGLNLATVGCLGIIESIGGINRKVSLIDLVLGALIGLISAGLFDPKFLREKNES
jgi:hypothetical protein